MKSFRCNYFFLITVILLNFCGCGILSNRSSVMTMRRLAKEKAMIEREVSLQEANFDKLLSDFTAGKIPDDITREWVLLNYGEPVVVNMDSTANNEIFIYRYPMEYADTDKIYFEFDTNGNILSRKIVMARERK